MSDPIIVLGMHRSGTSFLIRALNLSGLWLGEDKDLNTVEGRGASGNPKGNYENNGAIGINNAILAGSGGAWFNPPRQLRSDESDAQKIRSFCDALETGCPAQFPRWGWKDPRTLLTLDIWLRALQRRVFVVASFRHPAAVAQSLWIRDKIPVEIGYALWGHYNALLLSCLRNFPHVLVRFDTDQDVLLSQVAHICDLTGLRCDRSSIESWHDPALVRSKAHGDEIPSALPFGPLWNELNARYRSQFPP